MQYSIVFVECSVLFMLAVFSRCSLLIIACGRCLQGVSVEAVDPVFQAKMLDMLKQTGRSVILLLLH